MCFKFKILPLSFWDLVFYCGFFLQSPSLVTSCFFSLSNSHPSEFILLPLPHPVLLLFFGVTRFVAQFEIKIPLDCHERGSWMKNEGGLRLRVFSLRKIMILLRYCYFLATLSRILNFENIKKDNEPTNYFSTMYHRIS